MKRSPKPIPLPEGVEDHGVFQRRFWRAQRCAWVAFALILLACLFGLLGRGGIFSRSIVHFTQGSIDLPAISRWNAPDDLKVTLTAATQDQIIFVDRQFLESFSVEGIDPPQKATVARGGRIGYVFSADPTGPTGIVFRLQTQQPGWQSYAVGIGDDVSERSTFIFVNQARQNMSEAQSNQISMRVELQADCFAGVWGKYTDQKGILDRGDLQEALNAAQQIGDDTLQKRSQGYVVPESFNHGTSAQRVRWFKRGFDAGTVKTCDTFSGDV